ncbi:MAG TPA: hypothetical protein VFB72_06480 [Verrucomicrobiae bacterium]|nr:hypothetical protein [Verrucomicrobiae bacterium]
MENDWNRDGSLGSALRVAQAFLPAVSQAFSLRRERTFLAFADKNVGETADKNVCVTPAS